MTLRQGGIGRNILNLGNRFAALGIAVDVLVVDDEGVYAGQFDPAVRVHRLPTSNRITGVPALAAYLLRWRPHALLTPNPRLTRLALTAVALTGSRTAVYANVHNTYSQIYASDPRRARKIGLIRKHYGRCSGIIAVSRGVAEDFVALTSIPAQRVHAISNPVLTPHVFELAAQGVDHPWLGPPQPPLIVGAGRLRPQKNFSLLLQAFACVRQARACRLIILGEGPQRAELEELVATLGVTDDVSMPGQVANPYAYMKQAAVFVLSSDFEGLGNVLVEALALGTPVVSTDCPHGPREILQDGRLGRLVPVGDALALAAAIADTLAGAGSSADAAPGADAVQPYTVAASAEAYLRVMGLTAPAPA